MHSHAEFIGNLIFPPLHILNILLFRGWSGGSLGIPEYTWEPFELSEQAYQAVLPKIFNPDWSLVVIPDRNHNV